MKKELTSSSQGSARRRSSQHADMRRKNESALLLLVRRFPGLSSADIARRSGLAPQTVSVLLKGLEEHGIVMRGEVLRGRRGQPAVPILINPDGGYGVGVEISWRRVNIVLLNLRGEVLARECWEVDYQKADSLIAKVVAGIDTVLEKLPPNGSSRVTGVGIAMPTNMHVNLHALGASKQEAEALEQLDVMQELREKLPFTVFTGNDGTAACRAECAYGRGSGYGDMVHIFINTYVGAGIFVDGRIIEGRSGDAASIGSSMVINAKGEVQALHVVASVKALENKIIAAGKTIVRIPLEDWDWDVYEPEVEAWLEEAAGGLALAIANSCTVVAFSAAIIDGIIPPSLLDRLVDLVRIRMVELPIATFEPPMITIGSIGTNGPAIGAANLPIYLSIFAPKR